MRINNHVNYLNIEHHSRVEVIVVSELSKTLDIKRKS